MSAPLAAFVFAVVLAATVAQSTTGFGFALVAMPLLVLLLDVRDAVVIVSLLSFVNTAQVARAHWHVVPWRSVARLLAGSVAGMPLGLAALLLAPADALRAGVGVSSIACAAALVAGIAPRGGGPLAEVLTGGLAGVLSTSTGMNGPPIVLWLQQRGLAPDAFRGALAGFFLVSGTVSLAAFIGTGVVTRPALLLSATAFPAVLFGHRVGARLAARIAPERFRRVVLVLLVLTAAVATATSLARLLDAPR